MSNETEKIHKVFKITNNVSKTFCLAKWHHTTIYLQTGETHSCYHPPPHKIQLDEIAVNPSALHNTSEKKLQRKEMLEGKKPAGCSYCWNIEEMGYLSDRHERTTSIYTPTRLLEITDNKWDFNVNPEYIEISFGNECNFKCGYCHPKHSSSYHKEIKDFGPYTMVKNHRNDIDWFTTYKEEENPYVDAWWKWWPDVSKTLNILRITGGEPLLQATTWKLLDNLTENPLPDLELNINSNFGVKGVLVERLATKLTSLKTEGKIKSFKVFTSLDTWGPGAEYIRTGLNLNTWENNFNTYLATTNAPITFMVTFNILSVTTFKIFLKKILEWRNKYPGNNPHKDLIRFEVSHLTEPLQYDINILPKQEYLVYMLESLAFMEEHLNAGFREFELEKFRRLIKYMETTNYSDDRILIGRKDFYNWFTEHDKRRNVDLLTTFPEMANFYKLCKDINDL